MRKILMRMAAVAATVVVAIGLAAAPASAAVDMPYGMAYGASTSTGTIHFTDGYSATVDGALHAVTTSKYVCVYGYNGEKSADFKCSDAAYPGGPNVAYHADLRIAVPGGVQRVVVAMFGPTLLVKVQCTRTGCIRL
jgi:hypothetical protein